MKNILCLIVMFACALSSYSAHAVVRSVAECQQLMGTILPKVTLFSPQLMADFAPNVGLPWESGQSLASAPQLAAFLKANPDHPQASLLSRLPNSVFEGHRVLYIDPLGVSQWQARDFRNWHLWEGFAKTTHLFFAPSLLFDILSRRDGAAGLPDEVVSDYRRSYHLAQAVVADLQKPETTVSLIANHGISLKKTKTGLVDTSDLFQHLYEIAIAREMDEAAKMKSEGEPRAGTHLRLPFEHMDPQSLEISAFNARHLLEIALRYQVLRHLITLSSEGEIKPVIRAPSLYTAATYPELLPLMVTAQHHNPSDDLFNAPMGEIQDRVLGFIEGAESTLISKYALTAGPLHPFLVSRVQSYFLKTDLKAIGIDDLFFDLRLARQTTPQDRLGAVQPSIELFGYSYQNQMRIAFTPTQIEKIESILNQLIALMGETEVRVMMKPKRTSLDWHDAQSENAPRFELKLLGPNVGVAHYVQVFLLLHELARYGNGRW